MWNRTGAVTLLLFLATTCYSQTPEYLSAFFKQNIGLKDAEIARIERGEAVAKILDSPKPSHVFVFGAISIKAQPS